MLALLLKLVHFNNMKSKIGGVLKLLFVLGLFVLPAFASAAVVTVKPGPFPDGMDVWFGSVFNTSSQHDGKLLVGGWGDEYDTYTRYNLSGLPQTATQAILWFNAFPRNDGSTLTNINWYQVNGQWHAGSIAWGSQPPSTFVGSTGNVPASGWYGINITSFYNNWRSGNPSTSNFGFRLRPVGTNNQFDQFYGSATGNTALRPQLDVYYTPQANDSIIKLKWPLASPVYASRVVTQAFGVNWSAGVTCNGLVKKHNGTDFQANSGTVIYAAEDGIVKEVLFDGSGPWGYNIVTEHTSPTGGKYTTVYWHVQPVSDVFASNPGGFIPKGMQVATVYNLGSNTHYHIGARIGAYTAGVSGTGALPQTACGGYPAFPAGFVDPNNTGNVIFN